MPKPRSNRSGKTMPSKRWTEPGPKKKKADEDLMEGLGRAHQEDFLGLEDHQSDEDYSDEENENPVFNVKGSDDEGDDDDVSDDLDEEQLTGLEARMLKQSKLMKQKAELEEDDDEEEEDEKERTAWGKSKKLYYSADNVDFEIQSDDEEAPAEEEAEVLRLQRKTAASLRPEDYEQDEEESDGGEETLQQAVKRKEEAGKVSETIAVEEVKKDINALSKEEKMDVVISDAPELVGLLAELREGLNELGTRVQPLVEKVKDGQYATKEGMSYVEVKHLLLLSYCQSIIFYLLLKAEGRSVRDHPVIPRLVELRLLLEKIRPLDKRLQHQIDKLLKTAIDSPPAADYSQEQKEDGLKYRPIPDLLVSNLDEDTQSGGGVYRPPVIAPLAVAMAMEEDVQPRDKRQKDRVEKESRQRASKGAVIKEIGNELEGKAEEVEEIVGTESKEMMREKARLDARAKEEEELFARVPLSRVERKKVKQLKQSKSGLMDLLDDFDDGFADLVGMDEDGGPPDDVLKPRKLSQVIAESGRAAKKSKVVSGDADLPTREDLGERRRKHEMQSVQSLDENAGSDEDHQDLEPEEDEFYKEAKQLAGMKKAAKRAKYDVEPTLPSVQEDEEGKRHITNMMEKNRGLTPHRKKLTKNPRKKYKLKHDKALIRRKGQVRPVKPSGGSYGGESTGIRTNLSRSIRIQN